MPPETRTQKTSPETGQQTCPETEPETGNPPIKRADGAYRPLDEDSVKRIRKILRDNRHKTPEMDKHEIEFWDEHGLNRMFE